MNKLPYFLVALCLCMFCSFSAYADDAADPAQADSAASSDEVVVPPEEGKVVQVQGVQTYDPQLYERMDKLQESIDALTEALIPAAEGAESSAEDAGGQDYTSQLSTISGQLVSLQEAVVMSTPESAEEPNIWDKPFYIMLPLLVVLALVAVLFVVILTNAERRIPVQYAKRVMGRKMYGGQASYIPIKVNMTGVMPIIFASTLCSLPGLIFRFINLDASSHPALYAFFSVFNYNSALYLIVYVLLIVAFNYFYVAIQYNPVDIANQLRKNNGTIPGIRPGKPTSDFITKTLSKITLIGAVFLAIVAGFPIILGNITGTSIQLGGTTLLIVVGVALETGRSLEGYMTARYHKGFLE